MRGNLIAVLLSSVAAPVNATTAGEYLFHAAGCEGCHTSEQGPALAGGRAFETPYGTFYSPNITPDEATGIGTWTLDQFIAALKHGTAPDGSVYFPVFPYPSYRLISDDDAAAIHGYLRTREPQHKTNRDHEPAWWLGRWMIKPWQWWMLEEPPRPPTDNALVRGWYLVDALGHCGECHTPRKFAGLSDRSRYLAGTRRGPDGDKVPNITAHRDAGIGKWDDDELDYFLETGALPDGDYTGDLMAEVIDNTTSRLTTADRRAVIRYLRSVAPIAAP